jgi:hypothetical protein
MPLDIDQTIRTVNGWQFAGLRRAILITGAAQVALWCYLWAFIARHANPMGDGMEWVALVPATGILGLFVAPALIIGAINRLLILGALFAIAGAVLNVLFFIEITRELVGKP